MPWTRVAVTQLDPAITVEAITPAGFWVFGLPNIV
jgi:hypothetical protein